jgi:hypothetical protein
MTVKIPYTNDIFHKTDWMMKFFLLFILAGIAMVVLSGCQAKPSACTAQTGTPNYLTVPSDQLPTSVPASNTFPVAVEIAGKTILVDRVIDGPLCNDTWSGTVYVTCKFQVYPWVDQPTFLKGCNLSIAPGTVVYVAYHNDAAYYNGCSCHTGEIETPGP